MRLVFLDGLQDFAFAQYLDHDALVLAVDVACQEYCDDKEYEHDIADNCDSLKGVIVKVVGESEELLQTEAETAERL